MKSYVVCNYVYPGLVGIDFSRHYTETAVLGIQADVEYEAWNVTVQLDISLFSYEKLHHNCYILNWIKISI